MAGNQPYGVHHAIVHGDTASASPILVHEMAVGVVLIMSMSEQVVTSAGVSGIRPRDKPRSRSLGWLDYANHPSRSLLAS